MNELILLAFHTLLGNNGNFDIYVQRINHDGEIQWDEDGIPICTEVGVQKNPNICGNYFGEAIIVWYDQRFDKVKIFAQKINVAGELLWDVNGISVFPDINITITSTSLDFSPRICNDGESGVIISCFDQDNEGEIYIQKIDQNGNLQWGQRGVPICTINRNQGGIEIISDNNKGAIVVWEDIRNGAEDSNIYAQLINTNGEIQWDINGKPICNATKNQDAPQISITHNSVDAFIIWKDQRNRNTDIYGRKINIRAEVTFLKGDVNEDGSIDIIDALITAQYYVGLNPADLTNFEAADVNEDGDIDILDTLLIARYYVGLIDEFPT